MLGFNPISGYAISSVADRAPGTVKTRQHTTDIYKLVGTSASTPQYINGAVGGGGSNPTATLSVTAGNQLILVVGVGTNTPTSISDSQGNVYTLIRSYTPGNTYVFYYIATAQATGSVTVTVTTGSPCNLNLRQYSGVATVSPVDVGADANGTNSVPTLTLPTTTTANDLILGAVATANSYSSSAGAGFGNYASAAVQTTVPLAVEDLVLATPGTQTVAFSGSSFFAWNLSAVALKPGAAGSNRPQARSHSTDVSKRQSYTRSHNTDTYIGASLAKQRNHRTDVNKRKATLSSFTTDVSKYIRIVKTFTTDVNKIRRFSKAHTTDVYKTLGTTTTVTSSVTTAGTDDADENISNGAVTTTLTGQETSGVPDGKINGDQHTGFRFPTFGNGVPQGTTITQATIEFSAYQNYSSLGVISNTLVYGEATDNSASFSTATSNISSRARTTANTAAPDDGQPINITSVVQEMINRSTYTPGNPGSILFIGNGTAGPNLYTAS